MDGAPGVRIAVEEAVAEDHVQVEVVLPWLLQRFAEVAQAAIQNRGKLLLTKKS